MTALAVRTEVEDGACAYALRSPGDIAAIWPGRRAAFVAAHPGHELALHGWFAAARPLLHVLTDGSGHTGAGRAQTTVALADALDVPRAGVFAPLSDGAIYRGLMDGDTALFLGLLDALAASFTTNRIDLVVADASEGYNPSHDLCRVLVDEAVRIAGRRTGRGILNYAVRLTDWELGVAARHGSECIHLHLGDALFDAKLAAARRYRELGAEIDRALLASGAERFRVECLHAVADGGDPEPQVTPHYERVGRARVSQGIYPRALTFRDHVLPVMTALRAQGARGV